MQKTALTKFALSLLFSAGLGLATHPVSADAASISKPNVLSLVGQSILEMPLADGVNLDDAVESMKLRANQINFKLVAELPLSKQVEVMTGEAQRRMTIYQFCDAMTAKDMVDYDLAFVAFLPCRIAIAEDEQGKGRILMLNMDPMIKASKMPPALRVKAVEIQKALLDIMVAGANGEL